MSDAILRAPLTRARSSWRRWVVALSIAVALIMLLQTGTPASGPAAIPPAPAGSVEATSIPSHPARPVASLEPGRESSSSSSHPLSYGLCLVTHWPACPASPAAAPLGPAPLAGSPDAWTNVTPTEFLSAYPDQRIQSSTAYDPLEQGVVLFGGYGIPGSGPAIPTIFQDTWLFSHDQWTPLIANTSCTATTCPSPRFGAAITYDAVDQEIVLFGGIAGFSIFGPQIKALSDTWTFADGRWMNITATAGPAPPSRGAASFTYDAADGYALLFGGLNDSSVDLGDTWTFAHGTWTNLTESLALSPEPRDYASIAASPSGYVMLFGGENNGTVIQSNCGNVTPWLMWWFFEGQWFPAPVEVNCIPGHAAPSSGTSPLPYYQPGEPAPCGREGAALGWSPQNARFVLYGGYGPVQSPTFCANLNATELYFNDTWEYTGPLGGPSNSMTWENLSTAFDPPARAYMGYASDYTDSAFVIFGGESAESLLNETWRYFEPVTAELTGPSVIYAGQINFDQFLLEGYGGSGDLEYSFAVAELKTSNPLTGTGCGPITSGATGALPPVGALTIDCTPATGAYNIFRLTATVTDVTNLSMVATASWTVTIDPPEALNLYSQYVGYFYSGFSVNNVFGAYAEIDNAPVTNLVGSIDGVPVGFSHSNASLYWWNSSAVAMGNVAPGYPLIVTASISNWEENANLSITIIQTPSWLQQLTGFYGVIQSTKTVGNTSFGNAYFLTQSIPIPFGQLFNFSVPIPFITGNYSLVPDLKLVFEENSTGGIKLQGSLDLTSGNISLGTFSLKISISLTVAGQFQITSEGGGLSTITWQSAQLTLTIAGDFSASIPIYGFSFNLLGNQIKVGFNLDIDIDPSVALSVLLLPATSPAADLGTGLALEVAALVGELSLPISVDLSFGIAIASVAVGGNLSLQLNFNIAPGPFDVSNLWINGSIFGKASFLCFTATWNVLGPANIYHWIPSSSRPRGTLGDLAPAYDNGSDATWQLANRYYNVSGYDANLWNSTLSAGPAIGDIYPSTSVGAAGGADGSYLLYGNDDVERPTVDGLTVSLAALNASSNELRTLPGPNDPGYEITRPVATTLPDGDLYVLWDAVALIDAEGTATPSPSSIVSVALHGATYDPTNASWGPVQVWSKTGIAASYAVDDTDGVGRIAELVTSTPIPGATSPESLLGFNLTSGAALTNVTVQGLASITSVRGSDDWVVALGMDGNATVLSLATGQAVSGYSASLGSHLVGEEFVPGTPSTLLLRYRSSAAEEAVLYDLGTQSPIATQALNGSVTDAHAIFSDGTFYLVASDRTGVEEWSESAGTFAPVSSTDLPGITSFDLVQAGSSILVYGVVAPPGNQTTHTLELALLSAGLAPLPSAPSPPSSPSRPSSPTTAGTPTLDYELILAAAVVVVAVVLAVIPSRYRPPSPPPPRTAPASSGAPPAESPPRPPGGAAP
jgi:hypothetical protein